MSLKKLVVWVGGTTRYLENKLTFGAKLFVGIVPANNTLFARIVPANNTLFAGTLPMLTFFCKRLTSAIMSPKTMPY